MATSRAARAVDGAGDGRDHRPHARRFGDRRRAHRARSDAPRRHRHELRDRSRRDDRAPAVPLAARAHVPVVPAERGPAVGRRRPHPLRPHPARRSPTRTNGSSPSSGVNIVGGCCGTTPDHLPRGRRTASATRAPVARTIEFEPGCSSIYSHVPFHQELSYLAVGERTNANGSKKFREAMLAADWDTCVQMAREQVKEGAHVLDVCVDYVGHDGTIDMEQVAARLRDPGEPAARVRLDRTAGDGGGPAATTAARRSSTRPTSKRVRARASGWTACCASPPSTAPRSSASPSTRRARPAPRSGSCASRSASTTSRRRSTASTRPT